MLGLSQGASAETLRVATFNTELQRKGPGLLLRDIARGEDDQIIATLRVIAEANADVIALQGFDYDLTGAALSAYVDALAATGIEYPYQFAARPNTGMPTGLDMDGDGYLGDPRDGQSYGQFSGQGGMAVLSRHPIDHATVQDFSAMLWRDVPEALLPQTDAGPFPSEAAQAVQRLSTTGHWVVPVDVPELGRVTLMTFHASPPVFDGPEDRNGRRNHDEIMFWHHYLDGAFGPAPADRFVLLGDFNQDRRGGEGIKAAINATLEDPRLQDPMPESMGSVLVSDDAFDTVDWTDPVPGNLRVDYVLPSSDWRVVDAGVLWPDPETEMGQIAATASRHRLVWVDITR
ncbi:endonuclease/exonuclease/phosphatase family protein [uncultured Roseobacter sp.]|uniref:endonuclease/exonuclease/phosphatase family protein n=1 Tax=uncultured Roseobacter sp. TaxID=114847 RepID=UPI00262044CA|nr:endonuclease/exonuclease/phosphatase family protein [uncultured Roseobacter sp.]